MSGTLYSLIVLMCR